MPQHSAMAAHHCCSCRDCPWRLEARRDRELTPAEAIPAEQAQRRSQNESAGSCSTPAILLRIGKRVSASLRFLICFALTSDPQHDRLRAQNASIVEARRIANEVPPYFIMVRLGGCDGHGHLGHEIQSISWGASRKSYDMQHLTFMPLTILATATSSLRFELAR